MKPNNILILLIISFLVSSCFINNCHKFGPNFHSVNFDKVEKEPSGELVIELATITLDKLPAGYFGIARTWTNPSDKTKEAEKAIQSFRATKDMIRFVIKPEFVPKTDETFSFAPLLNFPDREGFLDCRHPGGTDNYLLFLEMDIYTLDGNEYQIDNLVWQEDIEKGAL